MMRARLHSSIIAHIFALHERRKLCRDATSEDSAADSREQEARPTGGPFCWAAWTTFAGMAARWYTLPVEIPQDGTLCYVRLNYWFGQPFKAYWREALQAWEPDLAPAYRYPFWTVSRWRPV